MNLALKGSRAAWLLHGPVWFIKFVASNFNEFLDKNGPYMSAAIAFYAFFSIFPLGELAEAAGVRFFPPTGADGVTFVLRDGERSQAERLVCDHRRRAGAPMCGASWASSSTRSCSS